eukprot:jgi/Mesvir1/17704/Mv18986-RA.1
MKGAAAKRGHQIETKASPRPRKKATETLETSKVSKDPVLELFNNYAEDSDTGPVIGPDGIERLCRDLHLEVMDIKVLHLAWKLRARHMGYFTLEEWRTGLAALRAASIDSLKKNLQLVQKECEAPMAFRDLYNFAFRYCLTAPGQKTLELDTAMQMLQLVLADAPHIQPLLEYLTEQREVKGINLDQWQSILRFSQEVDLNFTSYDDSQAWPVLLDNFVEHERERRALRKG